MEKLTAAASRRTVVAVVFGVLTVLLGVPLLSGAGATDTTGTGEPGLVVDTPTPAPRRAANAVARAQEPDVHADFECKEDPIPLFAARFAVDGKSRMAKLDSTIDVGTGEFIACAYANEDFTGVTIEGAMALPVSKGYFVIFDFVPSTSDVHMVQDGEVTGSGKIVETGPFVLDTEVTVPTVIRLVDVRQDQVPLDVGRSCRTKTVAKIKLSGRVKIEEGSRSEMSGSFSIPLFRGCGGSREDLDPLFNGVVSGPDNKLDVTLTMLEQL